MRNTIIIAHRGASAYAKENTLESFRKAIDIGADMIEFDVRRTKDHVLIALHDELLEGMPIRELTFEEILKIAKNKGYRPATFEEVLQYTSAKVMLDVELKEEGYEQEVIELLTGYFKKDQFVMTSFYDSCIKKIKENNPNIQVGLILGISKPKNPIHTRFSEFFPLGRCKKAKADFLVPHWRLLSRIRLDRE